MKNLIIFLLMTTFVFAQQSGMVIFTSHNVPDIPNLEIFDLKNDA